MRYVPGMKVPQLYRQQFWAAARAGAIDPEQEAWCLVWMDHLPASAHPDAMAATAAACDQYPEWEKAAYGQSPRPKYLPSSPSLPGARRPISTPTGGQKGWMSRRPR
ncbi:hypothetical protein [Streptomyces halobius]|uniref:Uncharacterized protein n=1 Tax=Streptomyces halobius TaxID=2879846 RepID=A0ABY4M1A3_9ACTN|nr:hypothetical protein [Streptomyces halobius]UQA91463.1 hypothetical protein K9S39_05845 [Streptomyces halobius]